MEAVEDRETMSRKLSAQNTPFCSRDYYTDTVKTAIAKQTA